MTYYTNRETYELEEKLFKEIEHSKGLRKLALIVELQGLLNMNRGQ